MTQVLTDEFELQPQVESEADAAQQKKAQTAFEPHLSGCKVGDEFEVFSPFCRRARIVAVRDGRVKVDAWVDTVRDVWKMGDQGKKVDMAQDVTIAWQEIWGVMAFKVFYPDEKSPDGVRGMHRVESHVVVLQESRKPSMAAASRLMPRPVLNPVTNQPDTEAMNWQVVKVQLFVKKPISAAAAPVARSAR